MDGQREVEAMVAAAFEEAALDGYVHALDIDGTAEVGYRGGEVCQSASTGKVPILVALMRAVAAGEVALDERILIPADGRTAGPSGLSVMTHPAELALRDVAHLMISISDNHATDVVLGRVPPHEVTAAMRELGLTVTSLDETIGQTNHRRHVVTRFQDLDLRPQAAAWRTTAAEMCRLLRAIWRDEAAPAQLCEEMRTILRSCLTSNGLESEFPLLVQVRSGRKTGTLFYMDVDEQSGKGTGLVVRNEVGVLEYPDGHRYAVAVFTRTDNLDAKLFDLKAEHAIGAVARIVVEHLAGSRASVPDDVAADAG